MSLKEWIIGGGIVVAALIGGMLSPAVNESQIFKAFPEFNTTYSQNVINTTQTEAVLIKNIGKIQAKNADIFIQSNDDLNLQNIDCPESLPVNFDSRKKFNLKLPKFSINLDCSLEFDSSNEGNIYSIVVVADDTPGYQHQFEDEKDDKRTEPLFGSFSLVVGTILLATASYASVVIGVSYFVIRFRKQKQKRIASKTRLNEIQNEIEKLKNERKFLEETSRDMKAGEIPSHWIDRIDWIDNELARLSSEQDQITGIISTDVDLHDIVGKFFTNWALLENQLIAIASRIEPPKKRIFFIKDAIAILQKKEILTSKLIKEIEFVKQFRNKVAHGIIQPSKKQLEVMNVELENLVEKIYDLQKRTEGQV